MNDWITFPSGRKGRLGWAYDAGRATQWQRMLEWAHSHSQGRPHCHCWSQGGRLELVVRSMTRPGEKTRRYYLARMPGDGPLHNPSCPFHDKDPRRSGRTGYQAGVIKETADGGLRVSLKNALMIRELDNKQAQNTVPDRQGHKGRPRQSKMTLLGLLHLLWEESGLIDWSPAAKRQRDWWPGVRMALHTASNRISVGARKLSDHLAMFGYNDTKGAEYFRATAESCGSTRRVLLLGKLNHLGLHTPKSTVEGATKLPRLRVGFDGGRNFPLFVRGHAGFAETLARRFPWAWNVMQRQWKEREIDVVALVSAELRRVDKPDGPIWTAWADEIALMETGPSLIPVASSYELAVLEALQKSGRVFRKPLRFEAHKDDVLPDFELLDTQIVRGLPMEVFGRTDETYAARREEKARYYTDVYGAGGWWSWDATSDAVWPPFPPPVDTGMAEDPA